MNLKTDRLLLREFRDSDLDNLIGGVGNIKISSMVLNIPHPYNKNDGKKYIEYCKKEISKKPRENYEFAIELLDKKGIIGSIGLHKVNEFNGTATIGYWLAEEYWRKGIMKEVLNRILDFSFKDLKLRRINIEAYYGNDASNGLIKKVGFVYEGMRRKYSRAKSTGKIYDVNQYGMLRSDRRRK
jgi:[ribosomal protein S5]-alanine N-acetyltransferase